MPRTRTDSSEWLTCSVGRDVEFQDCSSCGAKDSAGSRASGRCNWGPSSHSPRPQGQRLALERPPPVPRRQSCRAQGKRGAV